MNKILISAIICTHNPRPDYLHRAISALASQTIKYNAEWELIVIDNKSDVLLSSRIDLSWHPNARIIREDTLGLTHARLLSFHESSGEILVYIDDDNIIDQNYLEFVDDAFQREPTFGAIGGKVLPRYEAEPPSWFDNLGISLACRDLGDHQIAAAWNGVNLADRVYPECSPIGAGMAIRRAAYANYVGAAALDQRRLRLGRRGADLASGEDNDIIMGVLEQGWKVAYLPELQLEHLIPAHRLSQAYLENYAYSSNRSWVQALSAHDICPWAPIAPWTAAIRKGRAFVRTKAWSGPVGRIRWRGACGLIDGRASISPQ